MKNYQIKIVQSNITGFYSIVIISGASTYIIDLQIDSIPNMKETEIMINFVEWDTLNYTFVESDYNVFATYYVKGNINGFYKLTKISTQK